MGARATRSLRVSALARGTAPNEDPAPSSLWDKLDRILGYARPDGERALRGLEAMSESISEYLAMVFHRFLAGEASVRRRRMSIVVNGERLDAWDPFARTERATQTLAKQRLGVERDGRTHAVVVRPYVLPSQAHFSSPQAHARAAGPKKWNRQQGLYIYRGDRMIQSGGWNRLRTTDEHSKLARIAMDIPDAIEDLFQINVAKMRVALPEELRPQLVALAAGVVTVAQDAYRHRLRLVADPDDASERPLSFGAEDGGWTLGRMWPLITEVLARELQDHPDLLERVLVSLANTRLELTEAAESGA